MKKAFLLIILASLGVVLPTNAAGPENPPISTDAPQTKVFDDIYKYTASNMAYYAIGCFQNRRIDSNTVASYLSASQHYTNVKVEEEEVQVERAVDGRYKLVKEMGNVVSATSNIPYEIWNPEVLVYMTFESVTPGSKEQILSHYSIDFVFGKNNRSAIKQAFKSLKEDLEKIGFKKIGKDTFGLEMYNARTDRTVWIQEMYGSMSLTCFHN